MPETVTQWQNYRGVEDRFGAQVAPASTFDEPDDVQWSDYAKSIMGGGASLVQATGWLAGVLGAEDIGTSIEELGSDAVDFWNDSLSEPAKAELSKQVIRKNDEGEYEWGDPSFSTIGLMGAQSLLGTAAGMGMGAGLTKVLQVFANPFGRKALQAAAETGSRAAAGKLKLVDRVLGATGFGVGEGSVGGISAGASVYDNVMNMDVDKLMANDRYRQVYESTDNTISELERHQYAADTIAKEASTSAGWQSGLTTALLGAPMGAYFGRILGGAKLSSTIPRGIATGAAGEAAQEFAQSGVEQYISNIQTGKIDPDIDPFDDVLNAAVSGGLAGGLLGGVVGPAAVQGSRAELETERQDEVQQQTDYLKKIGKPLQKSAKKAAQAGVDDTYLKAIIEDWRQEKLSMSQALDNIAKLEREAMTGEPAVADVPPPPEPPAGGTPAKIKGTQPSVAEKQQGKAVSEPGGEMVDIEAQEPAEPKPISTDTLPSDLETVNLLDTKADAATFQFKSDTDAEGVSGRLKGVGRFDRTKAGVGIFYEDEAGTVFRVDSHQRGKLADTLFEQGKQPREDFEIPGFVFRAKDGVTPEEVTLIAATKNIAEGSGSAVDAAKVFRQIGPEGEREMNLPPNSALVKQGKALAKLDEDAFAKVVNEVIDPKHAAVVGEMIEDGGLQNAAIEVLRQTEPANVVQARAIVEQVRTAGAEVTETEDLFGEATMTESLYLERAKVLDSALKAARRDKATFRTLTSKESTITGTGKNKLDRAANEAKISDADRALTVLTSAANTKGPISDALTEAAREVKAGKKPGSVAKGFLQNVLGAVKTSRKGRRKPRKTQQAGAVTGELAAEGLYSRKGYPLAPKGEWYGEADYAARGGELVEMSPQEFLDVAAPLTMDEESRENIDLLKDHIRAGKTLDPLTLYDGSAVGDSDGRHRAIAAQELGMQSVPVVSFRDAAARRKEALDKEIARRDRIRNTGQLALFSRGKPLGDIRLVREFEVEETGETVEVEQSAEVLMRQLDKRRNIVQRLRECVRG